MLAGAETEMAERPAIDIKRIGFGKPSSVAVGGAERQRHLVAGSQGLAVQDLLAHDGTLSAGPKC